MSKVVKLEAAEERLTAAGRWVARMDRGLSAAEEAELEAWMAADPKNTDVLLSMTRHWDEMEDLSRLAELFPEADCRPARQPRVAWAVSLAAAVVLAVGAWWLVDSELLGPSAPVADSQTADVFETAIGEQSTVTLSDGSTVVLNTNSRVRVAYSDSARILHLRRGEIHIDVADDATRPFSVIANDRILQAVGTAFSVEITDDRQIELVVTEGRVVVAIQTPATRAAEEPPKLAQSPGNTVSAGEEIRLGVSDEVVKAIAPEEIEAKLSWREGRLVFLDEPLEAALAEVERYTTIEFVFLDPALRTEAVTGQFRTGDVDTLLEVLRLNFGIAYERAEDGRVLLSSL